MAQTRVARGYALTAKSEAIKEFAERFVKCAETVTKGRYKEHPVFNELPYEMETEYRMSKCRLDALLKETVGE